MLAMIVVSSHLAWYAPTGWVTGMTGLGSTAAVLGFLVISGYSIGHSLARRPDGFYRRRVLRIYPLFAAAVLYAALPFVLVHALYPSIHGQVSLAGAEQRMAILQPTAWQLAGNLLMLQNLVCLPVSSNLPVWTLGIEVACYLAAPRLRPWPTSALLAVVAVSATAFGIYPWMHLPHYAELRFGLPLLMFTWAWVAGFLMHRHGAVLWWGVGTATLGAALLTVNETFPQPYRVHTFVGTVLLVTVAARIHVPNVAVPLLNHLGDLSYPLYLFHLPTFLMGYCVLEVRSAGGLLALALAISVVFLLVEATLKRILTRRVQPRDRPTRSSAAEGAGAP